MNFFIADRPPIELFFSTEYNSWFLSRSRDVEDQTYVGRLPLALEWSEHRSFSCRPINCCDL